MYGSFVSATNLAPTVRIFRKRHESLATGTIFLASGRIARQQTVPMFANDTKLWPAVRLFRKRYESFASGKNASLPAEFLLQQGECCCMMPGTWYFVDIIPMVKRLKQYQVPRTKASDDESVGFLEQPFCLEAQCTIALTILSVETVSLKFCKRRKKSFRGSKSVSDTPTRPPMRK